jgi:hypothetical protein
MLETEARGCPTCALNLEAESMIDRFIWRRFLPGLLLILFAVAALVYFWR